MRTGERGRTRRRLRTTTIGSGALVLLALVATPADAALVAPPDGGAGPLEVVDADVSGFPQVTIDVALPRRELASDVTVGSFEAPGAAALGVEPLDPADLTIEVVLDDGPEVDRDVVEIEQGAMAELLLGLPAGVVVGLHTTSGLVVPPSADRAALFSPLAELGSVERSPTGLPGALDAAAARLAGSATSRRQLVVITPAGADITAADGARLRATLDAAAAAMRAVVVGDSVGPELSAAAARSGGASAAVGSSSDATVRAVDVLTTTFSDQFRLLVTMTAPGSQTLTLAIGDRRYETTLPDLGVVPTTAASTTTTPSTTAPSTTTTPTTSTVTPPTTAGPSTQAAAGAPSSPAPPSAATARAAGTDSDVVGVVQAVLVVAALLGIVGIVVWQWRRRVPTGRPVTRRR